MQLLSVNNLHQQYKSTKVLRGINFDLQQGEFIAIIGRSGAGKSTLLRTINGSVAISAGQITNQYGADICQLRGKALRQWRSQCAMIFQDFCLVPRLDVITNVLLGSLSRLPVLSSILGYFPEREQTKAIQLLEWLALLPNAMQRAEQLSGGQQQRVAICRALMQSPKLILADEPVASLDPENTKRIMQALQEISRQDISILINLHSIELVKEYATRVIALHEGQIIFDGSPQQLSQDLLDTIYRQ